MAKLQVAGRVFELRLNEISIVRIVFSHQKQCYVCSHSLSTSMENILQPAVFASKIYRLDGSDELKKP